MTDEPDDPDGRLEEIVAGYLERAAAGRADPPDGLLARHPEFAAELAEFFAVRGQLDAAVGPLRAVMFDEGAARPAERPAADEAGRLGDFRLLREAGRGGMGVVYEAEQISLGRRVALKVLPFAATLDPRQLQRFKNEALAAAALDHPHVVDVYGVGCERGTHYYAMRFVEGHSLAEVIDQLRRLGTAGGRPPPASVTHAFPTGPNPPAAETRTEAPTRRSSFPPSFFRSAAELGLRVAEALEHAHQQGVVHRDVKPSNLLLDAQGKVWVADFGLARVEAAASLTGTGDVVGTLRYMAPEQALGRGPADHTGDVYGLGATLYELLTRRPAFPGADREELLRRIAAEEPPPPRRLDAAIPADLETIILKAMAKDPDDRYPTAQAVADDLRRFLEDRPVLARRPGPAARLRRWARRHRSAVAAAVAALAVLAALAVAGLAASNWYVARERDQKDAALREKQAALDQARAEAEAAERERRQAEANLHLARRAVDEAYDRMAGRVAHLPQGQALYREFLLTALRFYQEFARQKGSDPEIRLGTARAYCRVGQIQLHLRHLADAEASLTTAADLLTDLAAEYPAEPRYRAQLAEALQSLGGARADPGRAEQDCRRAAAEAARVAADTGQNPESRHLLARTHLTLGGVLTARPDEAAAAYRTALTGLNQLAAEQPGAPAYRDDRAACHYGLGRALRRVARPSEAEAAFREVIALADRPVSQPTSLPPPTLGGAYAQLADLLAEAGRNPEAADAYRRAVPLYEKHLADFPHSRTDWFTVNRCYARLADLAERAGSAGAAAEWHGRALDLFAGYVGGIPDEADFRAEAAQVASSLADVLKYRGERRDRAAAYRRMLDLAERLAARFPRQAAYRSLAGYWQGTVGSVLSAAGRSGEAVDAYRRAQAHYQAALALEPGRTSALNNWAWLLATCPEGRLRDARRAVELGEKAVAAAPRRGDLWNTLGVAHYRAGDWAAAAAALERSMGLYAGRSEAETYEGYSTFVLAMARWRAGDRAAARRWYDRAVRWAEAHRPKDEELLRFRGEAAGLLAVNDVR